MNHCFLKPDGVRTRYCIGWNGYGRYLPNTLKVTYNGLPCNISEESNGIFYNFDIAPSGNYDDYEVTYITRPLDYAFSTGDPLGGYTGEEYFLFPNWNNTLGEKDAFWIGKYQAGVSTNNIPQSRSGVNLWINITIGDSINASISKGTGFNIVRNRQWVSIALWCDHHNIAPKGNMYGNNTGNLDGDYTSLASCGGGYLSIDGNYIVTGANVPNTWNHNGLSTGIHNMVGNVWEFVNGLENRNGKIYIFDEDNSNYVYSGVDVVGDNIDGKANYIVDITNTTQAILNEGIANIVSTNGYIPSNLSNGIAIIRTDQINPAHRGVSSYNWAKSSLWDIRFEGGYSRTGQLMGFRLARDLI